VIRNAAQLLAERKHPQAFALSTPLKQAIEPSTAHLAA
jgi:hypothetical protein